VAVRERETASREIVVVREVRRWSIHGLAVLAAAALWAYLRRVRAETAQREAARAQLEHEVQARTEDLRALAANLQTMQEDERALLSRELHDELGGLLTAAKLDLARAARAADLAQSAERIGQAGRRIDEVVGVKRRIIEDLRPTALEHLGLRTSLEQLCRDVAKRLEIEVVARLDDVALPAPAQIAVYRLVQEALTNIQKYARAKRVDVTLTRERSDVQLVVQDNGQGFDTSGLRVARHGLAGMRYRVEALGGRLAIRSSPGEGTRIEAHLPSA
jgi:signal transduction histidine kinase